MRFRNSLALFIMVVFIGAIIGSAIGEIIGLLLPVGIVKDFFLKSVTFGFSPTTINLVILTFTIGALLKINIIGVIGIFLASYIFRWYT
jgi:hypothetical protein